jgi:hypothetical protein
LIKDSSFFYDKGVWRGSLSGAPMSAGVMDIGDVVQQFLKAPGNINAANPTANAQQLLVVNSMLNYMSNYNNWAFLDNYNINSPYKPYLISLQAQMMTTIEGLYKSPGNYPTNPSPCLQ